LENCNVTISLDYGSESLTKPPTTINPKLSDNLGQTDQNGYAVFEKLAIDQYAWGNYTLTA
jgi:hypothetical protein